MTAPTVLTHPCGKCNQRHTHHPRRGYAHPDDGHPWTPPDETDKPLDWQTAFLGMFARCPVCAALVDNKPTDVRQHQHSHDHKE